MHKALVVSLFVTLVTVASFADGGATGTSCGGKLCKPRDRALATHHTIKVGAGLKKVGHAAKVAVAVPAAGAFDALEASVDGLGVAIQAFADAVDMGIAAPLESLPKPLNAIGVGVHYVYNGLDFVGEKLAQ